jgi:membrane protein involved in colicin uptake
MIQSTLSLGRRGVLTSRQPSEGEKMKREQRHRDEDDGSAVTGDAAEVTPRDAFDDLGREMSELLRSAHAAAAAERERGRAEAETVLADANAVLAAAKASSADTEAEANETLADAKAAAEATRTTAEQEAAEIRDAAAAAAATQLSEAKQVRDEAEADRLRLVEQLKTDRIEARAAIDRVITDLRSALSHLDGSGAPDGSQSTDDAGPAGTVSGGLEEAADNVDQDGDDAGAKVDPLADAVRDAIGMAFGPQTSNPN